MIYFITGSKNKFEEVKLILPEIEQLDIDLPEIQELDAKKIVRAKLIEALNHHRGEFIVEDTSLYLDCINGLPGPLIKWFLDAVGVDGLAQLAEKLDNNNAEAKTVIGYVKNHEEIYFFEGVVAGRIVPSKGDFGFGWDKVFMPDGHDRTFGEMECEVKNKISMRQMAAGKLKEFLHR